MAASDGFTGHFKWLLLTILGFQHTALLNKRLGQKCLSLNFEKLRTSSVRTPPIDCFFCLSVNMRNFSDNVFYWAPLRNYLFHLPSKHLLVLKTSSKSLQRNNFSSSKTSWRRLEDVLKCQLPLLTGLVALKAIVGRNVNSHCWQDL